jgi:hypothetical protein
MVRTAAKTSVVRQVKIGMVGATEYDGPEMAVSGTSGAEKSSSSKFFATSSDEFDHK